MSDSGRVIGQERERQWDDIDAEIAELKAMFEKLQIESQGLTHDLRAAEQTLAKVREILGPKVASNFWDDKASGDDCTASRVTIDEARELRELLGRGE